jgi:glycosidase
MGLGLAGVAAAAEDWPPATPLPAVSETEDTVALPPSVVAEPGGKPDEWRCTFRFRPSGQAQRVALAGSFNAWDRQTTPLSGPNADGEWSGGVALPTGVYEYKFVVDDEQWFSDPANIDRAPDSFGGFNSILRLGRLARLKASPASVGDGRIDIAGLTHSPPTSLYTQVVGHDQLALRYRTLSHDVQNVWLAVRDGRQHDMRAVCVGPLFTIWEARLPAPAAAGTSSPNVRSLEYTFVLDDGAGRVGDPHTYRYSFTDAGVFTAPAWAQDAVWYQVILDRFRNGDPANDPPQVRPWTSEWFTPSPGEEKEGQTFYSYVFDRFYGGDLAGLAAKLPYLKDLGVNALYLTPIFKAPSYHKYDVQNYVHVDDGFGTRGDYDAVAAHEDLRDPATWKWTDTDRRFLALVKQAHELGFKIVLDGVFNHVGDRHPAFLDVQKNGQQSPFADWFEISSWQPLHYRGWAGFAHMPVLRKSRQGFVSATLKQHLFNVTRRWMDPDGDGDPRDGIDGWRLDVPNEIPGPFWEEWRRLVKQLNPDALITGEIWHRADDWLDGKHFDAVMNYQFARVAVAWVFNRTQKITAGEAAARLAELRLAYPAAATYALQNIVGTHDTDRLASMALNPDREYDRQNRVQDNNPDYQNARPNAEAYARARLVALLQATYVGAPLIYYGDEAGMWGADDPTCRKPMLWDDLGPYEKPEDDVVLPQQLAYYKQALALRNQHPALRRGEFQTLLVDDAADVWAYLRSDGAERVLVILNASSATQTVQIPLSPGSPQRWAPLLGTAQDLVAEHDELTLQLPPTSGCVFVGS